MPGTVMRAAVSRDGAAHPAIEELEIDAPRAGEVLLRIVACGICHTDLNVHRRAGPKPIVLGHEGAGIVERVGPDVRSLAAGDHVVVSGNFCGHCANCRRGATSYCNEVMPRNFGGLRPDGTTPLSQDGERLYGRFFGQSSFAQYALVDAAAAVKVPPELPLETLAPLGCGVLTGAGCVLCALQVRPGDTFAVFGSGAVGLSAVMAAAIAGASQVIAVDRVASRLALARELGATAALDTAETDVVEAIRELTGGGVTHALNTTMVPGVMDQALASLAIRGTLGFVAPPEGPWTPDAMALLSGGRAVRGILGGDATPHLLIPTLIDYHVRGRFPFDRLIRHYRFEEIADAFSAVDDGTTIKPVLRMTPDREES